MNRRGALKSAIGMVVGALTSSALSGKAWAEGLDSRSAPMPFAMPGYLTTDHPSIIYGWEPYELTWLDAQLVARGDVFVVRGFRIPHYPVVVVYAQLWNERLNPDGQRGTYDAELTYSLDDAWRAQAFLAPPSFRKPAKEATKK